MSAAIGLRVDFGAAELRSLAGRTKNANQARRLIGAKKVSEITRADIEFAKSSIRDGKTAASKRARYRDRSIITGGPGVVNRLLFSPGI